MIDTEYYCVYGKREKRGRKKREKEKEGNEKVNEHVDNSFTIVSKGEIPFDAN